MHTSYHSSYHKKSSVFTEFKVFGIIFGIVFVVMLIVSNMELFAASFYRLVEPSVVPRAPLEVSRELESISLSSLIDITQQRDQDIQRMLDTYTFTGNMMTLAPDVHQVLQTHMSWYSLEFSTLPPVRRLIIPDFGIDVPIVLPENKSIDDFTKADFEKELEK